MIKLFDIEETTNDEEGKLLLATQQVAVNMAYISTARSLGDGRTRLIMSSGEQLVVKHSFSQTLELLKIELNK